MGQPPAGLGPLPAQPPRRPPWRWIVLGCAGIVLACAAFAVGVGALVLGSFRSSEAYQQALERARRSPALAEALGQPIQAGWWVTGSVNVSGPSGQASLAFPVSGPRGGATVYVEAVKRAGDWELGLLKARVEASGERLDLLHEAGGDPARPRE